MFSEDNKFLLKFVNEMSGASQHYHSTITLGISTTLLSETPYRGLA